MPALVKSQHYHMTIAPNRDTIERRRQGAQSMNIARISLTLLAVLLAAPANAADAPKRKSGLCLLYPSSCV